MYDFTSEQLSYAKFGAIAKIIFDTASYAADEYTYHTPYGKVKFVERGINFKYPGHSGSIGPTGFILDGIEWAILYLDRPVKQSPKEAYDKLINKVSTKYGAPMGRHDVGAEAEGRIYDRLVPLSQGYDKGGVYWGIGPELRVKYNACLTYVRFYRVE